MFFSHSRSAVAGLVMCTALSWRVKRGVACFRVSSRHLASISVGITLFASACLLKLVASTFIHPCSTFFIVWSSFAPSARLRVYTGFRVREPMWQTRVDSLAWSNILHCFFSSTPYPTPLPVHVDSPKLLPVYWYVLPSYSRHYCITSCFCQYVLLRYGLERPVGIRI